ncbi:MAG: P-loop NTPase [Candidatus Riflebacteria bacterium]|nr:P-loop NTPase [Candidatus Riflebacteria bacterium]
MNPAPAHQAARPATGHPPWIAIASGKGGTGKTSVAVSLALAAVQAGKRVQLIDADVEGPNAHHFLDLGASAETTIRSMLPVIAPETCTGCGACVEFCTFHALAAAGNKVIVFPDLCHACEGCREVCPVGAITDGAQEIGVIRHWQRGPLSVCQGALQIGQVLSPALIRALHRRGRGEAEDSAGRPPDVDLTIVDAPPGTACAMMAAIRGADHLLLVTEPTPFGRHDLDLAMQAAATLRLPVEVIINRSNDHDRVIEDLCRARAVPIVARLPESRQVAEAYAEGRPMGSLGPPWATTFTNLVTHLEGLWA